MAFSLYGFLKFTHTLSNKPKVGEEWLIVSWTICYSFEIIDIFRDSYWLTIFARVSYYLLLAEQENKLIFVILNNC